MSRVQQAVHRVSESWAFPYGNVNAQSKCTFAEGGLPEDPKIPYTEVKEKSFPMFRHSINLFCLQSTVEFELMW